MSISANEVRQKFVEFFEGRGHEHVASSSLVPHNDKSLLFVNAGMNQFKDVFTGRETRPYNRAVSVQRCLRAGGKHNDLDNVGFTPRHHTLFEMLGNFSFGDYFKADAIEFGWTFLTDTLGIDPARLVVTVFSGEGESAPEDTEAYALWTKFIPKDRIYKCAAKDNFWSMGDTGPCGPCSEIHIFNQGAAPGLAGTPGKGPEFEDDLYLELWNLVFMQYEKHNDGPMTALPKPSIDTGSGLERVAAVVGGFDSNYGSSLLAPLVDLGKALADGNDSKGESPYRVIADHARATAFLIADGVFPDKKDREYVLRRIMRRAIRHGSDLGLDEPFFHRVTAKVVEMFGEQNPALVARASTIEEVVKTEEEAFRRTLARGTRLLVGKLEGLQKGQALNPDTAADLYDTYGFPIDLTGIMVKEHGCTLDEAAAEAAVKTRQSGGADSQMGPHNTVAELYFQLQQAHGDSAFTGYGETAGTAKVVALVQAGESVASASAGSVEVVLDTTPMYAESGGQVGDTGTLSFEGGRVDVTDVKKPVGGLHVHIGTLTEGPLRVGDTVEVRVDEARRDAIRRNHSATHLLHLALREVLGDHVVQKGSLVDADKLRFDFSHRAPLTSEETARVEHRVNAMVVGNADSDTKEMTPDEAGEAGAIGLFGEKYGDRVRVVRIGGDSLELCGGTHVRRSGDIGLFAITSEGGIAQGVRRIEAVTGMNALAHVQSMREVLGSAMGHLHVGAADDLPGRIEKLQGDLKAKDRTIEQLNQKLATGGGGDETEVAEIAGIKLMARKVAVADGKALRGAADTLRDRLGSGVVVLGADTGGKATLLVAVTRDLTDRVHAGKLVGTLARHVDGRGGGRPDLAQAGGSNVGGLDAALDAASEALGAMLQ
ncbi:MAG: alanine--tRNA ligase [Nannocystaceae bacterium]|nr:alanine--tRNA ligase [bacterium]